MFAIGAAPRRLAVFGALILGVGCGRDLCSDSPNGSRAPTEFWQAHHELLPAGTKVCDSSSDGHDAIHFDFDPEPKLAEANLVEHLESRGWARRSQERHSGETTTSERVFVRDGDEMIVRTLTSRGRTSASYVWSRK
jgi:hypothetical protein